MKPFLARLAAAAAIIVLTGGEASQRSASPPVVEGEPMGKPPQGEERSKVGIDICR